MPAPLELQLPAWRPGRYELQNFAQKIQKVVVEDAATNQLLPYRKLTKDRWEVPNAAGRTVRVRYNFYAHQMDAGGSWLDETQLYLNPVQALMYAEGRQLEECELTLALPEGWQVACGLKQTAPNVLTAANFDQLADCAADCQPHAHARNLRGGRAALPRVGAGARGGGELAAAAGRFQGVQRGAAGAVWRLPGGRNTTS